MPGRCVACGEPVTSARRASYCSAKCRQRAYRRRDKPERTGNVVSGVDSFVGRRTELAAVAGLLREHRLVTLVGPAGSGKTRLATEVAARARREAWFVDLAEISDGALVPATVARALGLRLPLTSTLAARDLLLVLDNCEHLVESCASTVDELLRTCPGVTVLATSREALCTPGEQLFAVAEVAQEHAVRLFTDRARVVDLDFQPDERVAELCARLDGLPLAIELAARWVRVLPLDDILARLDDRFGLLTTGHRTAAHRHRSLQAAVDWSHELLSPGERIAFRRLSVLAGPFTLEIAAAVCAEPEDRVLHLVDGLAAKSLLQAEPGCYRMLESIRAYGQERLADEASTVVERLVDWVHGKLAPHAGRFNAPPDVLRLIDAHWQCVLVALEWALVRDDPRHALIAYGLSASWVHRGNLHEARRVLERAPRDGQVLVELSIVASALGDYSAGLAAADVAARTDAPGLLAGALGARAAALRYLGRADEAREAFARSLELLRGLDEPLALGSVLNNAAWAEIEWGLPDAAVTLLDEGLVVLRGLDLPRNLAVMLHTAGTLALDRGDLDLAKARFAESLETNPASPHQVPYSVEGLALVAARQGATAWAARLVASAAVIRARAGLVNEPAWQQLLDATFDADQVASAQPVPLDDAAAFALAGPVGDRPVDGPLSARELGVVALVAEGLTNKQIARRLGISPSTVATHLEQARGKLGIRPRAQLAAWFAVTAAGARRP